MTNPTSNFGWQMPTSTDLVTDLPADFEVFGQAVDTSLADLKGGTTNQVLAKNSNTDMDFKWVADAAGMTNPMTTTGDIIYSSPGSTPVRLGIGSTSNVLTVTGGVPVWAAPASGGMTLLANGTLSGTSVTLSSISGSYINLQLRLIDFNLPSSSTIDLVYNADTSTTYSKHGYYGSGGSTPTLSGTNNTGLDRLFFFGPDSGDQNNYCQIDFLNYATATLKIQEIRNQYLASAARQYDMAQSIYPSATAITSIEIKNLSGSFAGGTYELYGVK